MDPLSNQVFSHDYPKYVYQDPNPNAIPIIGPETRPQKAFNIDPPEKLNKSKKEEKDKNSSDKQKKFKRPFE